jgi:23S rRNA (guanosine2251-2'-O)-methyltransferase
LAEPIFIPLRKQKVLKMRKLANSELERKTVDEFHQAQKTPLIIVLDDVRSQHNIGSVFRTADAFLVEKMILCGITSTPPNKEIHKTALGATETVKWEYTNSILDAIEQLVSEGVTVLAVEQVASSTKLQDFTPEPGKRYAIVFGNEVFGVSQLAIEMCHGSIEIPQSGTKHSLNIAVSAGIVVWDIYRKMNF